MLVNGGEKGGCDNGSKDPEQAVSEIASGADVPADDDAIVRAIANQGNDGGAES